LILRAADVTIKQGRKLILVPRESPLSRIHLRNLSTLAGDGVIILPASPGFYHHPKSIDDLVGFVVGKILDLLDIDHKLYRQWKDISEIENR
ncbi:MAG: flavoprotein, partial [Nitrososphaerales archaeon]